MPSLSSNAQPLERCLELRLKTEDLLLWVEEEEACCSTDGDAEGDDRVEVEEEELLLLRPNKDRKLRNARAIPPLSLLFLPPRDDQEIRLGAPPLLNPPSTSVYTTGSSRSPVLLLPENLPTANPPPGSRQIVNPTGSSTPPAIPGTAAPAAAAAAVGVGCSSPSPAVPVPASVGIS